LAVKLHSDKIAFIKHVRELDEIDFKKLPLEPGDVGRYIFHNKLGNPTFICDIERGGKHGPDDHKLWMHTIDHRRMPPWDLHAFEVGFYSAFDYERLKLSQYLAHVHATKVWMPSDVWKKTIGFSMAQFLNVDPERELLTYVDTDDALLKAHERIAELERLIEEYKDYVAELEGPLY
jgi:hypothetical protein